MVARRTLRPKRRNVERLLQRLANAGRRGIRHGRSPDRLRAAVEPVKAEVVGNPAGTGSTMRPGDDGMSSRSGRSTCTTTLGVDRRPADINRAVVARMEQHYREHLPLLPGAVEMVRALHRRWPLALASSANRELIDFALDAAGLAGEFDATVSSEEVARGKPAPDVYLEAARRLWSRRIGAWRSRIRATECGPRRPPAWR